MTKLYMYVIGTLVEAENEEEAKEIYAENSWDIATSVECYEVCQKCLGILDSAAVGCICDAESSTRDEDNGKGAIPNPHKGGDSS